MKRIYYTAKISWLFNHRMVGYPGCRQTGDTVVTGGLLGIED